MARVLRRWSGMTQGTVLVVEDDVSIRELIAEILRGEGYAVTEAADGLDALRACDRERPALVLLDMRMPRLDGWSFASALRHRQVNVPVIVMTAEHNARDWAEEIDADGYLAKPFDLDDVVRTVARHAKRPRLN
jgi:CheY-like chemotaxis protein